MSESSVLTAAPNVDPQPQLKITAPDQGNQYRAFGLVKGQFVPQKGSQKKGSLVTPEDHSFSAFLIPYIGKPPQSDVIWRVWVKPGSKQKGLRFELKSCIRDEEKTPIDPNHLEQDYFSIRGQLIWWNQKEEDEKRFAIRIQPNQPQQSSFKPFFLVIYGELSNPQKLAFWDVTATREGKRLVLLEGKEVYPPKFRQFQTKTVTETVSTDELHAQVVKAIGREIGKSTMAGWLSKGKLQERLTSYCGEVPFEVEFAEKSGNKNFYRLKRTIKTKKKKKKPQLQADQSQKSQPTTSSQSSPLEGNQSPESQPSLQEANSSASPKLLSQPKKDQTTPTSSATIMVPGRIPEITVKFNSKIELPSEGKKIALEVQGENNIRVRATVNRKTLKKQVAKMEEFEDWVGALSGKINQVLPDGVIELDHAGIQVFEKKKKESSVNKESETKEESNLQMGTEA
jgi:hypothetical protein